MKTTLLRLLPLCLALTLAACEDGAAECPETSTFCNGQCTDLAIDRNSCGACGNVCSAGFQCVDGACACPGDETACGSTCTTLANDTQNCGACGNACESGEICVDGVCGEGTCGGLECDVGGATACIDPTTDEQNCGACGNVCGEGTSCLGGACTVGNLYAACFSEGTVVPLDKTTHAISNPKANGIDGTQSLAMLGTGHVLALGSMDQTVWVIDRATMQSVGSVLVGTAPNLVLTKGQKAYVVSSMENSIQVIDLADVGSPEIVDEVSLGEGTNPMGAAFDESGKLWVSLWLTNEVVPVDFSGTTGVKGDAIALDLTGVEGTAYPTGVAVVDGTVYVSLNNLDAEFGPAGNGRLSTYDIASGTKSVIDLGATCKNPGFMATSGTRLFVACTDSYFEGEVAIYDTADGSITHVATGGGPGRISVDPSREGWFYVADNASLGLFAVDPDGASTRIDVCPAASEGGWEFNADVLVAP